MLTSGIPAPTNDFTCKYASAQGKRMKNHDIRPPSRQKTPTKAVGLDDIPDEPQTPPERDLFIGSNQNDNNIEPYKSLEVKNDLIRKPSTNQAKRMGANQCTNFLENMYPLDSDKQAEVRNTFAHGFKNTNQKEYNLLDEVEPKNPNYQGTQWFFENSRKEETKKDDSFVLINLHNIYEMEGTNPHDDCSHLIDEDSEAHQKMRYDLELNNRRYFRPQTRDIKTQGDWFGDKLQTSASPDQRNKALIPTKKLENGNSMKVSLR